MGMLAAVEMWTKRDHQAEWDRWMSSMNSIATQVTRIDGRPSERRSGRDFANWRTNGPLVGKVSTVDRPPKT